MMTPSALPCSFSGVKEETILHRSLCHANATPLRSEKDGLARMATSQDTTFAACRLLRPSILVRGGFVCGSPRCPVKIH